VSSGPPESSGQNPRDWQSPQGSPGAHDAYGGQPAHGDPYAANHPSPYDQPAQPSSPYDQQGGQPTYEQPYGQQQPYDQHPYASGPDQYGAQPSYGAPGQPGYDQPYGAQGGYDQPYGPPASGPYNQPGYGPYQQGPYGYPRPANDGTRTHAIVALVISLVLAMTCYVSLGGIAGAILSGIALGKVETEPASARSLLKWAWIGIGINIVLLLIGLVAIIVAGIAANS
jgi:hypothetical protein